MIDVHSHILHCVDDGSPSLETSLKLIKESIEQGVTDIILTPHYNRQTNVSVAEVRERFEELKTASKEQGLPINLYLGQEVYMSRGVKEEIKDRKPCFINDGKFILIEFSSTDRCDVAEMVYEIKLLGYKPIVAHFERCHKVTAETAKEIVEHGGYIQVNAGSLVGDKKKHYIKLVKQLFKMGLVDFIASDVHDSRPNYMAKAFAYVSKKFGKEIAENVFNNNAKKLLKG